MSVDRVPRPIKIEADEDIIILDEKCNSPELIVIEWHLEVKRLLTRCVERAGENNLIRLMKEYIGRLLDRAIHFEDTEKLYGLVDRHTEQFYLLYKDLDICFADTYLDNMERILTFHVNLSLRVLLTMKNRTKVTKKIVDDTSQKIIKRLSFFLLGSEYHIFHVLIRQTNLKDEMVKDVTHILNSNICKQVFRNLYMHFLVLTPKKDLSDEAFCRAFILFENWKAFECPGQDREIDECLKNIFKRRTLDFSNNEFLRKILQAPVSMKTDFLTIVGCHPAITEAYFEYIKSKQDAEAEVLEDIEKLAIESGSCLEWEDEEEDGKYKDLTKKILGDTSNLPITEPTKVKEETVISFENPIINCDSDSDSDVEFVGVRIGSEFVNPVDRTKKNGTVLINNVDSMKRKAPMQDLTNRMGSNDKINTSNSALPTIDATKEIRKINPTDPRDSPIQIVEMDDNIRSPTKEIQEIVLTDRPDSPIQMIEINDNICSPTRDIEKIPPINRPDSPIQVVELADNIHSSMPAKDSIPNANDEITTTLTIVSPMVVEKTNITHSPTSAVESISQANEKISTTLTLNSPMVVEMNDNTHNSTLDIDYPIQVVEANDKTQDLRIYTATTDAVKLTVEIESRVESDTPIQTDVGLKDQSTNSFSDAISMSTSLSANSEVQNTSQEMEIDDLHIDNSRKPTVEKAPIPENELVNSGEKFNASSPSKDMDHIEENLCEVATVNNENSSSFVEDEITSSNLVRKSNTSTPTEDTEHVGENNSDTWNANAEKSCSFVGDVITSPKLAENCRVTSETNFEKSFNLVGDEISSSLFERKSSHGAFKNAVIWKGTKSILEDSTFNNEEDPVPKVSGKVLWEGSKNDVTSKKLNFHSKVGRTNGLSSHIRTSRISLPKNNSKVGVFHPQQNKELKNNSLKITEKNLNSKDTVLPLLEPVEEKLKIPSKNGLVAVDSANHIVVNPSNSKETLVQAHSKASVITEEKCGISDNGDSQEQIVKVFEDTLPAIVNSPIKLSNSKNEVIKDFKSKNSKTCGSLGETAGMQSNVELEVTEDVVIASKANSHQFREIDEGSNTNYDISNRSKTEEQKKGEEILAPNDIEIEVIQKMTTNNQASSEQKIENENGINSTISHGTENQEQSAYRENSNHDDTCLAENLTNMSLECHENECEDGPLSLPTVKKISFSNYGYEYEIKEKELFISNTEGNGYFKLSEGYHFNKSHHNFSGKKQESEALTETNGEACEIQFVVLNSEEDLDGSCIDNYAQLTDSVLAQNSVELSTNRTFNDIENPTSVKPTQNENSCCTVGANDKNWKSLQEESPLSLGAMVEEHADFVPISDLGKTGRKNELSIDELYEVSCQKRKKYSPTNHDRSINDKTKNIEEALMNGFKETHSQMDKTTPKTKLHTETMGVEEELGCKECSMGNLHNAYSFSSTDDNCHLVDSLNNLSDVDKVLDTGQSISTQFLDTGQKSAISEQPLNYRGDDNIAQGEFKFPTPPWCDKDVDEQPDPKYSVHNGSMSEYSEDGCTNGDTRKQYDSVQGNNSQNVLDSISTQIHEKDDQSSASHESTILDFSDDLEDVDQCHKDDNDFLTPHITAESDVDNGIHKETFKKDHFDTRLQSPLSPTTINLNNVSNKAKPKLRTSASNLVYFQYTYKLPQGGWCSGRVRVNPLRVSTNDNKLLNSYVRLRRLTSNTQRFWRDITMRSRGYKEDGDFPLFKIVYDKTTPNKKDVKYYLEPPRGSKKESNRRVAFSETATYLDSNYLRIPSLKNSFPENETGTVDPSIVVACTEVPEISTESASFNNLLISPCLSPSSNASSEFSDHINLIPYQDIERALQVVGPDEKIDSDLIKIFNKPSDNLTSFQQESNDVLDHSLVDNISVETIHLLSNNADFHKMLCEFDGEILMESVSVINPENTENALVNIAGYDKPNTNFATCSSGKMPDELIVNLNSDEQLLKEICQELESKSLVDNIHSNFSEHSVFVNNENLTILQEGGIELNNQDIQKRSPSLSRYNTNESRENVGNTSNNELSSYFEIRIPNFGCSDLPPESNTEVTNVSSNDIPPFIPNFNHHTSKICVPLTYTDSEPTSCGSERTNNPSNHVSYVIPESYENPVHSNPLVGQPLICSMDDTSTLNSQKPSLIVNLPMPPESLEELSLRKSNNLRIPRSHSNSSKNIPPVKPNIESPTFRLKNASRNSRKPEVDLQPIKMAEKTQDPEILESDVYSTHLSDKIVKPLSSPLKKPSNTTKRRGRPCSRKSKNKQDKSKSSNIDSQSSMKNNDRVPPIYHPEIHHLENSVTSLHNTLKTPEINNLVMKNERRSTRSSKKIDSSISVTKCNPPAESTVLPMPVPHTYNFETDAFVKKVYNSKLEYNRSENNENEVEFETHLPLKKRKLTMSTSAPFALPNPPTSTVQTVQNSLMESAQPQSTSSVQSVISVQTAPISVAAPLSKSKPSTHENSKTEEISYPATPMLSIADVYIPLAQRTFKTPAEKKQLPPISDNPVPICYYPPPDAAPFNCAMNTFTSTIYHLNDCPFNVKSDCFPYCPPAPILFPPQPYNQSN